jgi:hypothetical protein
MSKMTDKRDQYIKTIMNAFMYATNVLENNFDSNLSGSLPARVARL